MNAAIGLVTTGNGSSTSGAGGMAMFSALAQIRWVLLAILAFIHTTSGVAG